MSNHINFTFILHMCICVQVWIYMHMIPFYVQIYVESCIPRLIADVKYYVISHLTYKTQVSHLNHDFAGFVGFMWFGLVTPEIPPPRLYLPGTGIVDKLLYPHDIFVDAADSTSFLNASWQAIYTLGHFHIPFLMKNLITWSV